MYKMKFKKDQNFTDIELINLPINNTHIKN